jgi:hypothetical protein
VGQLEPSMMGKWQSRERRRLGANEEGDQSGSEERGGVKGERVASPWAGQR